ncbi:hypothetical protein Tco_0676750 [Tanacetum coccineum]
MAASLRHQWHDTICGRVISPQRSVWMHPRNARRVNTRGSGNDGDAQPTDIRVWLERFHKQKPQTFSSASTPVEAENWIAHIEKIFEALGCGDQFKARLATYKLEGDAHSWWRVYKLAGFLGAKAGTQEEQAKHFKWGLNDFVLDRILNTGFTNVAQVANAARNIEIFHDRGLIRELMIERLVTDMETVADMATKTGMEVTEGVVIDKEVTDKVMAVTDGVLSGYSDYASSPPCNICGKLHPGKACHRATSACFECGEVGQSLMMVTLFTRYVDMVVSSGQRTLDRPD